MKNVIDVVIRKENILFTLSCNLFTLQEINIHDTYKESAEINFHATERKKNVICAAPKSVQPQANAW
jgi:hypothetical protein